MFDINGISWELEFVTPMDSRLVRSDGVYTLGVTDLKEKRIYLADNLKGSLLDKVLSHELVHCFCLSYNYALDIETEEIVADFLSSYGRDVFDIADILLDRMIILYG